MPLRKRLVISLISNKGIGHEAGRGLEYELRVPLEETLSAFASLIQSGKVRAIGASNHSAQRLREALAVSRQEGSPRYELIQPLYNLYDRADFESELAGLVENVGSNARAGTPNEAAAFGDIVLIAVPYGAMPQIGRELGLLIPAARDVGVGRHDLTPCLEACASGTLDGGAGGLPLFAADLLVEDQAAKLHLHLADFICLWS